MARSYMVGTTYVYVYGCYKLRLYKVCLSDLGWLLFSDGGTLWPLPRIQVGKLFRISTKSMFQLTLGS